MGNYSFTRWRKFGHDRLYIADAQETKLGHVDLATGMGVPEAGQDREQLELLAKAWQQNPDAGASRVAKPVVAGSEAAKSVTTEPVATKPPAPKRSKKPKTDTPAFDLAYYQAGHAVRTKAHEERERIRAKHPIASRIAPLVGVATPDKSWAKGADGEQTVGARLEKLRAKGWHVLHSIPIGTRGSDIDHLLIGPRESSALTPRTTTARRSGLGTGRSW